MSSIDGIVQIIQDLHTNRYLTLAICCSLIYDIVITFSEEVELIWSAPWSTGKFLFFANRYPIAIEFISIAVYTVDFSAAPTYCKVHTYLDAWSTVVFIIPVQLIVVLRTIAIWQRNRWVIAILVLTIISADAVILSSIARLTRTLSYHLDPGVEAIVGCEGGIRNTKSNAGIPAWVALMVFDTTVFVFTAAKVFRNYRSDSRIMAVLFRDGVLYYTIMLVCSIVNLAVYVGLSPSRAGLVPWIALLLRANMSIVGNRIILNLRGVLHEDIPFTLGPLDTDDLEKLDEVELQQSVVSAGPSNTSSFHPISSSSVTSTTPVLPSSYSSTAPLRSALKGRSLSHHSQSLSHLDPVQEGSSQHQRHRSVC